MRGPAGGSWEVGVWDPGLGVKVVLWPLAMAQGLPVSYLAPSLQSREWLVSPVLDGTGQEGLPGDKQHHPLPDI
jgi:hypothetical protein